jgi:tRNA G18 (ribose-2'-O)-methylase SpoU
MSHQKLSMEQLGRMTPEEFRESNKIPVVLILENIRSGLNVGSLFRTADAFLLKGIFCVGYTPTPPHREVLKSALGATETVEWEHREATLPLIQELKEDIMNIHKTFSVDFLFILELFDVKIVDEEFYLKILRARIASCFLFLFCLAVE